MKKDDKVVEFTGSTRLDLPVDTILSKVKKAKLDEIIVIGFDEEGDFYFASSKGDGGDMLWLLEKAKKMLLDYEP